MLLLFLVALLKVSLCAVSLSPLELHWGGRALVGKESSFDWPGVCFSVRFQGCSEVSLLFSSGAAATNPWNWFDALVDGRISTFALTENEQTVLSSLDTKDIHTVTIFKRTEASSPWGQHHNTTTPTLVQLTLGGGDSCRVLPFEPPSRRIEFIGDSLTCGYGCEGKQGCEFSPATENARQSFAGVIASKVSAEMHIAAWSGMGVVRNYGDENKTSETPLPFYYNRTLANEAIYWDFKTWSPDMVMVNLGTNDYSTLPHPDRDVFVSGYLTLLMRVRSVYPQATIFVLCGPVTTDEVCRIVAEVARKFKGAIYLEALHVLSEPADYGCNGHPSVAGHEKVVEKIFPTIKQVMGW